MKLPVPCLVLGVFAGILAGCSTGGESASDTDRLTTSREVVGIDDLANKVTVNDDSLEFDADMLPKLKPHLDKLDAWVAAPDKTRAEPVFLIGNRQSDARGTDGAIRDGIRNPLGYLRRAISWSTSPEGKVVVQTQHATIAEASGELFAGRVSSLSTSSLRILDDAPDTGGETKSWTYTFGGSDGFTAIDLSGRTLWQSSVSGGNATIVLTKGTLDIKPTIDAELATSGLVPQNGKAVITTDVTGTVQIDATADGTFDMNTGGTLYSKAFAGVFVGLGGLPVTLRVDVKWQCGLGASGKVHAMIGATATGHLVAGAQFQGTDLQTIFPEPTYDLDKLGPSLDSNVSVHGECHLISTVAVQVFDAAGPDATVDLYAKAQVSSSQPATDSTAGATDGTTDGATDGATDGTTDGNTDGASSASPDVTGAVSELDSSLTFGVQATVGGQLAPFGYKVAEVHSDPLTFEKTWSGSLPLGL